MDQKKAYQYELSSLELNQEHIINVDYNMSMPIDLIDRDVFLPFPKPYSEQQLKSQEKPEDQAAALQQLRDLYLDEKDKFLLSDRTTFEIDEKPQVKSEKKIKLPSRYERVHKVNKWGVDIRNPIAVRQVDQEVEPENEAIMTLHEDSGKKDIAIKQIEKTFEQSKRIKVGIEKGQEHPGVTATKVIDFIPFLHLAPNETQLIVCDDNLLNELSTRKI